MSQPHAQWVASPASGVPEDFHEQPLLLVPSRHADDVPAPRAADVPARRVSLSSLDWRAQAPRLTAAVLAAIGAAELARLAWDLMSIPAVPAAAPAAALKPAPARVHWWTLQGAHLFGVPPTPAEQQAVVAQARPVDWVLTGVIALNDPASGMAIVGERGRIEVLRAGDAFEGVPGSRLAQIFSDHVVIDRQGQQQSVLLPQDRRAGAPVLPANEQPVQPPVADVPLPPRPVAMAEALLGSLNPEPHEEGGRLSGMLLHPNVWLQRQFGLREGDIMTAVNGVPLSEPGALSNALRGAGDTVAVTYSRGGLENTITMPVN